MKLKSRTSGSALILTVVIALILAILCSAIILVGYYNRYTTIKAGISRRLIQNEESAINLLLSDTIISCNSSEETLDLFNNQGDSILIKNGNWGLFQYGSVLAFQNQFERRKTFFYGSVIPDYMNACLYLADHQGQLSLSGSTRLIGNAYLSKAGVKAGYIDQRGYSFANLIEGKIQRSERNLPALNPDIFNCLELMIKAKDINQAGNDIDLIENDSVVQSFSDTIVNFFQKRKILLKNITLEGHIIIASNDFIEVEESAKLKDVILVAPRIKFKNNFEGTVQAIATDSLILESGCVMNYPSSLVLIKQNKSEIQNVIKIAENCFINGVIIAQSNSEDIFKSYVEIGTKTRVEGIVYTKGYLFLKGNVDGIVLTDYFIHKTPSTIFENHLVDAEINRSKLSPYFAGFTIFSNSSEKKVIKWVQ